MSFLLHGFLLGLAYVVPIGTQNLYIINTATSSSKLNTYKVALITIIFDILLAISCFLGVGILIDKFPILKGVVLLLGCILVIYIGFSLLRSNTNIETKTNSDISLKKIIGTCFAVTWLNPQAIIDGSLLLGGFKASLPKEYSIHFITGVCLASFIWFISLASIVFKVSDFANKKIKWINLICGSIIIFYGLKLGYSFISMI
ncbi:MAG: LysE family transporter [Clostridiales bacterium]